MKHLVLLSVLALIVAFVMFRQTKVGIPSSVKEGFDTKQEKQTVVCENSSYAQRTNHMPSPSNYMETPPDGHVTPFRVNQFNAYM